MIALPEPWIGVEFVRVSKTCLSKIIQNKNIYVNVKNAEMFQPLEALCVFASVGYDQALISRLSL